MATKLPSDPGKRIKRSDALTGYIKEYNVKNAKKERIAAAAATKKKVDARANAIAGAMKPTAKKTAAVVKQANKASMNTRIATIRTKVATTRATRSK